MDRSQRKSSIGRTEHGLHLQLGIGVGSVVFLFLGLICVSVADAVGRVAELHVWSGSHHCAHLLLDPGGPLLDVPYDSMQIRRRRDFLQQD